MGHRDLSQQQEDTTVSRFINSKQWLDIIVISRLHKSLKVENEKM